MGLGQNPQRLLLADAQKEHPEAEFYVDGTRNLNLLSGPSHTGKYMSEPRHDRILARVSVKCLGGGDW